VDWVGIGTVRARSPEWLRVPKPVRCDHTQLLVVAAVRERGGLIPGARAWSNRDWDRAAGLTRRAVQSVVDHGLAEWLGDDLRVEFYPADAENTMLRRRRAQQVATAAAVESRQRPAESLDTGDADGRPDGRTVTSPEVKEREVKERKEVDDAPSGASPARSARGPSDQAYRFADGLRQCILSAEPEHRIGKGTCDADRWPGSATRKKWARDADLMFRVDGRAPGRSATLARWAWSPANLAAAASFRIESAKKMRDRWDALDAAERRAAAPRRGTETTGPGLEYLP
jgi:hypothetical protein